MSFERTSEGAAVKLAASETSRVSRIEIAGERVKVLGIDCNLIRAITGVAVNVAEIGMNSFRLILEVVVSDAACEMSFVRTSAGDETKPAASV